MWNNLPDIVFIKKGYFYRYRVIKEKSKAVIDIDEIEKFVNDREYEAIPEVFPNDYGKIANLPSMWDGVYDILKSEIKNKGGLVNFLMFKDEEGTVNWTAVGSIYTGLIISLWSIYMMCRDAANDFGSNKKIDKKEKDN